MEPPLPHLRFDPELDVSPFALFRRLREGRAPALYELRPEGRPESSGPTLRGAQPLPTEELRDWSPPPGEVVIFDRDGGGARDLVATLRFQSPDLNQGVRALFGGLRLYDFALDPRVVGEERHLVNRSESSREPTVPGPRPPRRRRDR